MISAPHQGGWDGRNL